MEYQDIREELESQRYVLGDREYGEQAAYAHRKCMASGKKEDYMPMLLPDVIREYLFRQKCPVGGNGPQTGDTKQGGTQMARQNGTQTQNDNGIQQSNIGKVKGLLNTEEVKRRFSEILGQKAPQFMASITNAVNGSAQLQQVDANSIMAAALVAATYDLPIDNNLGFSAIVPYKGKAQFQMMYKGFIQLAIRSGYYEKMNYAEVYEDELIGFNPITGEVTFVPDFSRCTQRAQGATDKIVGYYAWFRLKTGFSQELYMSRSDVYNHARKYSQSYRYDLDKGRKTSRWSIDFDVMAKKTVIKLLLSKWGILSIDMQRAIQDDQKVYDNNGVGRYDDNTEAIPQEAMDAFTLDPADDAPQLPTATGTVIDMPQEAQDEQAEFAQFEAKFSEQQQGELPWD